MDAARGALNCKSLLYYKGPSILLGTWSSLAFNTKLHSSIKIRGQPLTNTVKLFVDQVWEQILHHITVIRKCFFYFMNQPSLMDWDRFGLI